MCNPNAVAVIAHKMDVLTNLLLAYSVVCLVVFILVCFMAFRPTKH